MVFSDYFRAGPKGRARRWRFVQLSWVEWTKPSPIVAARSYRVVALRPFTGSLRANMSQIEQGRDQNDRKHVSARESEARRDENGLQSAIARSFDIGHLAFFFGLLGTSEGRPGSRVSLVCCAADIALLHQRD
jgi:hypothetical protein